VIAFLVVLSTLNLILGYVLAISLHEFSSAGSADTPCESSAASQTPAGVADHEPAAPANVFAPSVGADIEQYRRQMAELGRQMRESFAAPVAELSPTQGTLQAIEGAQPELSTAESPANLGDGRD
jgi:hypothetical protein